MTDKSDKRERIMEIAKKHFMEKGYYKTSIEDIANDLGVAKGTIYLYFQSKSDLFIEIIENEIKSIIEKMESVRDLNLEPEEKISKFIDILWDLLYDAHGMMLDQKQFITDKEIFIPFIQRIYPLISEINTISKQILAEGIYKNKFKNLNIDVIGNFLMLSLRGYFLRLIDPIRYEDKEVIKEILLRGILC
jgi:AcrR family transcriptional regulator